MPIYIIRPKAKAVTHSLNLTAKKFTPESRQPQLEEVISLWKENKTYQTIQDWVKYTQTTDELRVIKERNQPGVTGTVIVQMSAETANKMQQEVPDALILNDIPIELIQPQRDQTNSKNTVNTEDIWHLDAIGLTRARTNGYKNTGKEIKIAVLDTGIDPNHPELLGKVVESHRFKGSEWKVEPQNVSVDSNGHGTHVAGLICGHQIGVAPDVQLINGMTLADPKGRGTLVDLVLALEWVASRSDIQIVNISAGIPQFVEELELLVRSVLAVGILPVCAIGNNGRDITSSPGNCRGVISVGATTRKNQVWGDSSSSQMTVDQHIYSVPSLVAPGHEVYSCVIGGGYEAWNGTSMATPIVSGVAALMLQSEPLISVGDMRETLLRQCQKLSNELNERQGAGIIQV